LAKNNDTKSLIEKVLICSLPKFWEKTFDLPRMFNPTIAYWQNKSFLAYRAQMYDVPIQFEWFSFQRNNLLIYPEPNNYGLRYDSRGLIRKFDFNQLTEDARLYPRSNGQLLVQYTCKASLFSPPKPCYVHLYLSPETKKIAVTETTVLADHPYEQHQKNWVLIEWQGQLYFIQSINPFHLLLHNETNPHTHVGKAYLVQERPSIRLPWGEEFGLPIRGGTPTHLLRGLSSLMKDPPSEPPAHLETHAQFLHHKRPLSAPFPDELLLAFFHTVRINNQTDPPVRTYFMGAMAFCPNYPFQLFSMSSQPILLRRYYERQWADFPKIDYVMFAIGIFERPESEEAMEAEEIDVKEEVHHHETGEDHHEHEYDRQGQEHKRHVWVTFGYLDKHGAVAKFDLRGLLDSMEIIEECS
jgi:hypothetical protein